RIVFFLHNLKARIVLGIQLLHISEDVRQFSRDFTVVYWHIINIVLNPLYLILIRVAIFGKPGDKSFNVYVNILDLESSSIIKFMCYFYIVYGHRDSFLRAASMASAIA